MTPRRLPPPRQVEQIDGGFKVLDANGQPLAYTGDTSWANELHVIDWSEGSCITGSLKEFGAGG